MPPSSCLNVFSLSVAMLNLRNLCQTISNQYSTLFVVSKVFPLFNIYLKVFGNFTFFRETAVKVCTSNELKQTPRRLFGCFWNRQKITQHNQPLHEQLICDLRRFYATKCYSSSFENSKNSLGKVGSDVRTYLFWFRFLVRSLHLTYSGRIFFLIKKYDI